MYMYLAGAAVARARSLQSQCCKRARVQHWAVEVRRLDDGARGSTNHGRGGNNSTTNRNWPCNVNEFLTHTRTRARAPLFVARPCLYALQYSCGSATMLAARS